MKDSTKSIAVGADDAAFDLKAKIVDYLQSKVDAWLASAYQGGRSTAKVERMKQIDQQFHQRATAASSASPSK